MNNNIFIEVLYEFKRVHRNILFRIFMLTAIVGLIVYQFTSLSRENHSDSIKDLFSFYLDWPSQALSSSIAFKSAYYFNIIQSLFIICFAVNDLRASVFNTKGALYARPQENSEMVVGKFLGRLLVITLLNWISFTTSIVFNFILYSHSFDFTCYLFYWITLTFPASVYFLGISYLVTRLARNPGISFTILVLFLGSITYWSNSLIHGLLNPYAHHIPNMFSDFTGHVNLANYLLQRACILLTGTSFMALSIIPYPRIPNDSHLFKKSLCIGCLLLLSAGGGVILVSYRQEAPYHSRGNYVKVYEECNVHAKARVIENNLHVKELLNGNISVNSQMSVINKASNNIPLIVYLNPGLRINSIKINDEVVSFQRKHQAILIDKELHPGQVCSITINYEGNIDNSICFLDTAPPIYDSPQINSFGIYQYGYSPSFCEKNYKLLTPECIWYPVTIPPYERSGYRNMNFSLYSLRVEHSPHFKAISQGEIIEKNKGETWFHHSHNMPGISLCIGNYTKRRITIDSTRVELYCLPNHEYLLEKYGKGKEKLTERFSFNKEILESKECIQTTKFKTQVTTGENRFDPVQQYPYRWFILLEVPCSFHCFPNLTQLTGTREQGGIVFIPEKLYSIKDYPHKMPQNEEEETFMQNIGIDKDIKMVLQNGECDIRPVFRSKTSFISSPKYPIIHEAISNMIHRDFRVGSPFTDYPVVEYLKHHSLKDALHDNSLSPDELKNIIDKKGEELYIHIMQQVEENQFREFYIDFLKNNLFKETTIEELFLQSHQAFGTKLDSLVNYWYNINQLPLLEIQDARAIKIEEADSLYALCSFKVYNKGEVPGIVATDDYQCWIIPPYSGKEIKTRNFKNIRNFKNFTIRTPLAQNLPASINFRLEDPKSNYTDKTTGIFNLESPELLPGSTEIIIDNEDPGFKVVKTNKITFSSLFQKEKASQVKYHQYFFEDKWLPTINEQFHGFPIRSALFKRAGSGTQKVEWNALLPQEGKYEVFFYYSRLYDPATKEQELHYTIFDGKEEHEVIVSIKGEETGWVSLGKFNFYRNVKVTLSDKDKRKKDSENDYPQELVADAVKWVKF